jgi:hypothetical protein
VPSVVRFLLADRLAGETMLPTGGRVLEVG